MDSAIQLNPETVKMLHENGMQAAEVRTNTSYLIISDEPEKEDLILQQSDFYRNFYIPLERDERRIAYQFVNVVEKPQES